MLHEVAAAQKETSILRRWFEDDYFSIIVFYKLDSEGIYGFQLCYNIFYDEHSLTWTLDRGFTHNKIDDERGPMGYPSTPLLVEDGLFPANFILNKFIDACQNIDKNITELIISKIIEFGRLSITAGDIEKI